MFRTPPQKLDTTFEKEQTHKDRQPTEKNLDPDIVETNILIETGAPVLPGNISGVAFTIPTTSSDDQNLTMTTVVSKEATNPNLNTINERPTGAIPKLKRSGRILDFSKMELNIPNKNTDHSLELPKNRKNQDIPNLQLPITSQHPKTVSNIPTQTKIFPSSTTEHEKTRYESDEFYNTLRNTNTQNLGRNYQNTQNYQREFDTLHDSNVASNFPTNDLQLQNRRETHSQSAQTLSNFQTDDLHTRNRKNIQFQHSQIPPTIDNTNFSMQPNRSQNLNSNMNPLTANNPKNLQSQNLPQPRYTQYTTLIADNDFSFEDNQFQPSRGKNI